MKVAIAFSTKDRVELSKQTIAPLLAGSEAGHFDLFINDGSNTKEGELFAADHEHPKIKVTHNVRGGADAAIVFALTQLLNAPENYDVLGLVENDVLLHPDWAPPTLHLFERGRLDGLSVGAVSARSYDDRILVQRDGYALMHNLGAGMVLYTREAAEIALKTFRTCFSLENRRTFMQLTGLDIGHWWAFRNNVQGLCADWHIDTMLAQHGLASLALTPAMCEMIGQVPPLIDQGLKLVTEPVELLRKPEAFEMFALMTKQISYNALHIGNEHGRYQNDTGQWTIFPHQVESLGAKWSGDWGFKWAQGFGPFAWVAGSQDALDKADMPSLTVPVSGPCAFFVSGGKSGGTVELTDTVSGYSAAPKLDPEGEGGSVMRLVVPAGVSYRKLVMTAVSPGVCFYGMETQDQQPWFYGFDFDHNKLPPVA